MTDSNAKRCLAICPLFEAELLLELMLKNWDHPLVEDESFRSGLLESATELLMTASDEACDQVFIEGLLSSQMNLIAAIWYCEWISVQDSLSDHLSRRRQTWLKIVRRSLPSCFCSPDLLEP
jgi:hypothetical protein